MGDQNRSFCSKEAEARGWHQHVFSYAYFEGVAKRNDYDKNNRDFFGGIERNLHRIQTDFPGSLMRLYYQVKNKSNFLKTACKLACTVPIFDLCDVERIPSMGNVSHIFPLLWRFLPGMDRQVDLLLVRDLDSDISKREQDALQEF